ncbi:MFS transporter [Octadecabacter sp. R77987]|uniref:MFS transporter n=1 Tax=Octadecabacter sp. R77987 TaxID=3093874 RepID=UPI00366D990D
MSSSLFRTTLLTIAVFALQALAFGAWLALIPDVQIKLGLNKAQLALALLGMPIATIPTLQVASRLVSRFGPRRLLAAGFLAQPLSVILPLIAVGQGSLFAGLLATGFVMAFMQVSLNVYAGRLEKQTGATVMIRCHGFWAIGLMLGSLFATLSGVSLVGTLLIIALPAAMLGVVVALSLPRLAGEVVGGVSPPRRALRQIPPALFYVSIFALAISMTEGAMSDWAAIYLAERLPEGARHAGIAVTIYSGFLAVGRLIGDALKIRLGAVRLARLTVTLAILGLGMLVMPLPLGLAYVGFACIGLGASVGFPLGVSAAAALDDTYEGANIAIMSSVAICGFLIGPPLIGFLAEAVNLRVGLAALIPLLVTAWVLAGALRGGIAPDSDESESVAG